MERSAPTPPKEAGETRESRDEAEAAESWRVAESFGFTEAPRGVLGPDLANRRDSQSTVFTYAPMHTVNKGLIRALYRKGQKSR